MGMLYYLIVCGHDKGAGSTIIVCMGVIVFVQCYIYFQKV